MSNKNSKYTKQFRRKQREIRHAGGCAICGDEVVEYIDAKDAPDPSYPAICRVHLAYAVSTIFVGENPGLQLEDYSEHWRQRAIKRNKKRLQEAKQKAKKEVIDPVEKKYGKPIDVESAIQQAMRNHKQKIGEALDALFGQSKVFEALDALFGHYKNPEPKPKEENPAKPKPLDFHSKFTAPKTISIKRTPRPVRKSKQKV